MGRPLSSRALVPPYGGTRKKESRVLAYNRTTDYKIVVGVTSLPDKPAAAAQPGASDQWQMLQPTRLRRASPGARNKSVIASHDSSVEGPGVGVPRTRQAA